MLSRPASRAAICSARTSRAYLQELWDFSLNVSFSGRGGVGLGAGTGTRTRQASSSSSSTRWKSRQGKDSFAREARVQGLKSRAAFKLLEIDAKYKVFKRGQTVVDLGYAPGSWSQVAVERTKPNGRIVGIDIIPAQPPKGVSTIQGNFLSKGVQEEVKRYLSDPERGRPKPSPFETHIQETPDHGAITTIPEQERSYIDLERHAEDGGRRGEEDGGEQRFTMKRDGRGKRGREEDEGKTVDVVLSDMSAPWEQTTGFWKRSLSDPYHRMMNTTGIAFRDHAGSMDLCNAALQFARDTLRSGGSFVCKFYQGSEDKEFERQLKLVFKVVHREKPESSRAESKEAYFVALRKKSSGVEKGAEKVVEKESKLAVPAEEDIEAEVDVEPEQKLGPTSEK